LPRAYRSLLSSTTTSSSNGPPSATCRSRPRNLRAKVETIQIEGLGASSLTTAELRLLPLLPTHLSFREIGDRLFVSRHTVKTHAISIYRKLGVSSRSEAIDRMHELGLLEHS
jgi:LuxR family maltose regulon positive regulatory protein